MKIDEAIEIITNAVQTDKMTVEQDDICCPACGIEIAAMDDYEYEKKQYKCCPYCGQKINWEE